MKKIISLVFILFLVGCSKNNYITCSLEQENKIQNYIATGEYKIYYKDKYVTKIEKLEKYISTDQTVLNYFQESKKLEYYNLNDLYGGYDYNIKNNGEFVLINTFIDTSLVDFKKMVKNQYIDKNYVISNKLTTSGIIKKYESIGAICNI